MTTTFSTGITPSTSTPALDFYNNTISPALVSAGWVLQKHITDENTHGITGANWYVDVWLLGTGSGYVSIAYQTAAGQTGFQWRISEGYNNVNDRIIRPAHGGNSFTNYTVGADGSVGNGATYLINTVTSVGYVSTYAILGGSRYVLKVTDKYLAYASRSSNTNYHVEVGEFTDLQTAAGVVPTLMLGGHSTLGISWTEGTKDRTWGKVTREIGVNGQNTLGAWCVNLDYPFPMLSNTYTYDAYTTSLGMGRVYGGLSGSLNTQAREDRNHVGPIVGAATMHNLSAYHGAPDSSNSNVTRAALRGYLPDFVVGTATYGGSGTMYQQEPPVGTYWDVNGVDYYVLGQCALSNYTDTTMGIGIVAVKSAG